MIGPSAPRLVITLELERAPAISLDASSEGEWLRMRDWIHAHPDLGALYDHALDVLLEWQPKAA